MRKSILIVTVALSLATAVAAQGKMSSGWNCEKPSPAHSLDVGDHAGHAYMVDQFKCTATKGEIGGVKEKEGTGTEFMEATGNTLKGHGIFIETLENGDKIHYHYETTATMKDGKMESATNKFQITGAG